MNERKKRLEEVKNTISEQELADAPGVKVGDKVELSSDAVIDSISRRRFVDGQVVGEDRGASNPIEVAISVFVSVDDLKESVNGGIFEQRGIESAPGLEAGDFVVINKRAVEEFVSRRRVISGEVIGEDRGASNPIEVAVSVFVSLDDIE